MSPEIVARAEAKPIAASGADLDAAERYGRLQEGAHIASYAFERALANLEGLLQADRWRNVGGAALFEHR